MSSAKHVLEEFAQRARPPVQRQRDGVSRDTVAEHAIYMPPWRRRSRITGELGPWEGPQSEAAFVRRLWRHEFGTLGGGLWDWSCDDHDKAARRRIVDQRSDADDMDAFVTERWEKLAPRERELYIAFYSDELTVTLAARKLGIKPQSARNLLSSLRVKLLLWLGVAHATGSEFKRP